MTVLFPISCLSDFLLIYDSNFILCIDRARICFHCFVKEKRKWSFQNVLVQITWNKWLSQRIVLCKQNIPLESFHSYTTFFKVLTEPCEGLQYTYISWQCMPEKKTTCQDIVSNWERLKLFLVETSNSDITVLFNYFSKTKIITKKGKVTKRL